MIANKLCTEALHYYGPESQVDMAIEEMAELTKALLKIRRVDLKATSERNKRIHEAREEVADVKLMMIQMEQLLDNIGSSKAPNVQDYFTGKVNRLNRRLEKHRK
jgi:hypothetical protein